METCSSKDHSTFFVAIATIVASAAIIWKPALIPSKHAFRDSLQGLNIKKVSRLFPLRFIFAFLLFPVLRTSELKSCIKRRLWSGIFKTHQALQSSIHAEEALIDCLCTYWELFPYTRAIEKSRPVTPSFVGYLTIILRNRAEYRLTLSRRGRSPSWLKSGDIPQDWAG